MVISWDGQAVGLADALASIRIDGASANTDSATISGAGLGRIAPFNFGAQNLATYTNVVNRLRIDVANDANDSTGGQISIFQQSPSAAGTNFATGKSVVVFAFNYNLTPRTRRSARSRSTRATCAATASACTPRRRRAART